MKSLCDTCAERTTCKTAGFNQVLKCKYGITKCPDYRDYRKEDKPT